MKASPDPDFILRGNDGPLTSIVFTSKNNSQETLLSGSQTGVICGWCLRSRRPLYRLDAHQGRSVLSLHPVDTDRLLSAGRDGVLQVWQAHQSNWVRSGSFHCTSLGFCPALALTINGRLSVATAMDGESRVAVRCVSDGETVCSLAPPQRYGMCMQLCAVPGGGGAPGVLVGYEDGSVSLWDVRTAREVGHARLHDECLLSLDVSADRAASGSVDDRLRTWTVTADGSVADPHDARVTNAGIGAVRWRADGRLLAVGGWDGRVRLFGGRRLKPLAVLAAHTASVQCVAFADDNTLAVGSKDGRISVWSVYK